MAEKKREASVDLRQTPRVRLKISGAGDSLSIEYTCPSEQRDGVVESHRLRSTRGEVHLLGTEARLEAESPYDDLWSGDRCRLLRKALCAHFDKEELHTLCSDLGVDYDGLRGEGKKSKARELVAYLRRRQKLEHLAATIRRERGDII